MSVLPPKPQELADALEETRKGTVATVSGLSARDLAWRRAGEWSVADIRGVAFPYPVPGPINLHEWPALAIRSHEQDRQLQIEGILRALGK